MVLPPTIKQVGFRAIIRMTRKSILAVATGIGLVFTSTVFGLTKYYETKLHNQKIILDNTREEVYNRDMQIDNLQKDIDRLQEQLNDVHNDLENTNNELNYTKQKLSSRGSSRTIDVELTHYTHTGNPTASGKMPVAGRTIACNFLKLGTHVRINGNVYTVEDRCGFDNVIDVFVDSEQEAIQKGRIKTTVEVL